MIRCPSWLDKEAKAYWSRNAPGLLASGQLNEATLDDFVLLCEVWGMMRAADTTQREDAKERIWYLGLLKQYQTLRKLFRSSSKAKSIDEIISEGME